ncbi:MAG: cupin domain-containing protein [Actinomycetota bacterium]|nr:cupin domain-containing protein [Actinomycetota bacterium]
MHGAEGVVVRAGDLQRSPKGTIAFEGEPYGSEVSMFIIDYHAVGDGPDLHRHPYAETWIVRTGNARFTVGESNIDASAGDVLVAPAGVAHMFKNAGPENLDIVCIHPSPRFIQEELG